MYMKCYLLIIIRSGRVSYFLRIIIIAAEFPKESGTTAYVPKIKAVINVQIDQYAKAWAYIVIFQLKKKCKAYLAYVPKIKAVINIQIDQYAKAWAYIVIFQLKKKFKAYLTIG